ERLGGAAAFRAGGPARRGAAGGDQVRQPAHRGRPGQRGRGGPGGGRAAGRPGAAPGTGRARPAARRAVAHRGADRAAGPRRVRGAAGGARTRHGSLMPRFPRRAARPAPDGTGPARRAGSALLRQVPRPAGDRWRRAAPYLVAGLIAVTSIFGLVARPVTGTPSERADYVVVAGAPGLT